MAALEAGIAATAATIGTAANLAATSNLNGRNRRWQENMWNKANEYNLPSAQKQRLIDAGINPYSVMAGAGSDTGNTTQSSSPVQFDYKPVDIGQHEILSNLSVAKDIQLKNIDIEKGTADMEFYRIRQLNDIQKMQMEISEMLSSKKLNDADRELAEKNLEILEAQKQSLISKSNSEADSARIYADNLERSMLDDHLEKQSRIALNHANVRLSKTQQESFVQSIKESAARINRMVVENKLTESQVATEVQKQASEICNRVVTRDQNKRAWQSLRNDCYNVLLNLTKGGRKTTIFGKTFDLPYSVIGDSYLNDLKSNGTFGY